MWPRTKAQTTSLLLVGVVGVACGLATVPPVDGQESQLKELLSPLVRIALPKGPLATFIVAVAPDDLRGRKEYGLGSAGWSLLLPADLPVDTRKDASRVLSTTLGSGLSRMSFRVDEFATQPGEPTRVDEDYVEAYAEEVVAQVHKGRLQVEDRALLVYPGGLRLALVGGLLPGEAGERRWVQAAYLSARTQLFLTLQGPEPAWQATSKELAQLLAGAGQRPRKR